MLKNILKIKAQFWSTLREKEMKLHTIHLVLHAVGRYMSVPEVSLEFMNFKLHVQYFILSNAGLPARLRPQS